MGKYDKLSKEELLEMIEKQDTELELKKYGLAWDKEREPEKVVVDCKNNLPILERIANKEIHTNDEADNIMIEGDNYHALKVLNYTHKEKIDVIYIDPPYNRGGDFFYNDKRIDREDGYRHSKWLNFMEKRLDLAKNLLTENGIMIISIDDSEYANLKLLCDKIFVEYNVETMIWRKSGDGRDGKMKNVSTFRIDHEYLIFCYNTSKELNKISEKPSFKNEYPNLDNDPRGPYKAGSISRREDASNPNHKNYYTVISPAGKEFTRQFDIPKEEFDKLNNDILKNSEGKNVSRIYWGKNGDAVPASKIFINEERRITPYSILLTKGTTTEGTKELNNILKGDFSKMRPKPSYLIETLIQLSSNKNSIVLDFFAGSGTTGEAVLKLNKKDKGSRKFIVCTNNGLEDEFGIATEICYPRLEKIIKGYKFEGKKEEILEDLILTPKDIRDINLKISDTIFKNKDKYEKVDFKIENNNIKIFGIDNIKEKVAGLGGNLQYFKTGFVDNTQNEEQIRWNLTNKCTDMLCVRENIFNLKKEGHDYKIFASNKSDKYLCIYYNFADNSFNDFLKEVKGLKGHKSIYMFSLNDKLDKSLFKDIDDCEFEPIPQNILDLYKRIRKKHITEENDKGE